MWLCAGCEKVSSEAIQFIGKFSECRIQWICNACDKLAINAVKSHSYMSNPLIKEISSCLNDTLMKPLNTVIEKLTKQSITSKHLLQSLFKTTWCQMKSNQLPKVSYQLSQWHH